LLVDSPTSLGAKARMQRWEMFSNAFPTIEKLRVLDVGGTVEAWRRAPVKPRHVTVLNLFEPGESDDNSITPVTGDACNAADELARANVETNFDLVFSNSLIEHVGGHAARSQLAGQVHRLAEHHWVQTPYRYFPLEPHWLFPGMQFHAHRGASSDRAVLAPSQSSECRKRNSHGIVDGAGWRNRDARLFSKFDYSPRTGTGNDQVLDRGQMRARIPSSGTANHVTLK
jgi:hypothetical protein